MDLVGTGLTIQVRNCEKVSLLSVWSWSICHVYICSYCAPWSYQLVGRKCACCVYLTTTFVCSTSLCLSAACDPIARAPESPWILALGFHSTNNLLLLTSSYCNALAHVMGCPILLKFQFRLYPLLSCHPNYVVRFFQT